MKLDTIAVHEAGHAVMAAAHGFEIKEVYIEKEKGSTEIALPELSAGARAILRESRADIINLDLINNRAFPDLSLDEKIKDSADEATRNLAIEIGKIADVLLAGWVAEETLAPYLKTEKYERRAGLGAFVARASEDVGDICKIIGLSGKNTQGVMACLIDVLIPQPTDPVSQYPEPLQSYLAGESRKQFKEKQLTAGFITELRDRFIRQTGWDGYLLSSRSLEPRTVAAWLYGKRDGLSDRLFRQGATRQQCIALAKRLARKKRLTGAEAIKTIEKIGKDAGAVEAPGEIKDTDEKMGNIEKRASDSRLPSKRRYSPPPRRRRR